MRTRLLGLAALAVLLVGMVTGGPASAVLREGFTVSKEEPVEKEYPAMGPGAPTGSQGNLTNPASCSSPARIDCDTIPIEIIPPEGLEDDRDIFFTIVELSWTSGANDLDLFVFDNGQSTGTQSEVGASSSTKNPEVVRVPNADLGEYNIVVENVSGANQGYTIRASVSTDPFTNPNESLAPDPPKRDDPEPEESEPEFTPPEDNSGEPPPAPSAGPAPTLPPVEGGPVADDDFDFGFSDLDDRITVNLDDIQDQGAAPTARKAEKVSPAVLLASLIGAPALIVGSGAAFAWKRRRELLI